MRFLLIVILNFGYLSPVCATRIKDIASLRGVRDNQLSGYGVVVGLSGTGDRGEALTESSLNMILKNMGVDLKTARLETKNVAAVVCSAKLPPFSKMGAHLDVTVSSIGGASSLEGGTLMMTPLRGPDGLVYAMAQGKVIIAKRAETRGAATSGIGMVSAILPSGAVLEREVGFDFSTQNELRYGLHQSDFTTSARIAVRINEELGGPFAGALDSGTVEVVFPQGFSGNVVDLVARIESIEVNADRAAKVIINQKSGTIVLGDKVRVAPVALSHANLRIEIKEGEGETKESKAETKTEATRMNQSGKIKLLERGTTIAEIATSLNEMGATADDLVAIVHALKGSGALMAEVEVQ